MALTSEQREKLVSEMKQISTALNLSDDQKQQLQQFMSGAYQQLQEYRQQNPNAPREELARRVADHRSRIRQQLAAVLTPEQLTKWDAEVEKIKDFLFIKLAVAASA